AGCLDGAIQKLVDRGWCQACRSDVWFHAGEQLSRQCGGGPAAGDCATTQFVAESVRSSLEVNQQLSGVGAMLDLTDGVRQRLGLSLVVEAGSNPLDLKIAMSFLQVTST